MNMVSARQHFINGVLNMGGLHPYESGYALSYRSKMNTDRQGLVKLKCSDKKKAPANYSQGLFLSLKSISLK